MKLVAGLKPSVSLPVVFLLLLSVFSAVRVRGESLGEGRAGSMKFE